MRNYLGPFFLALAILISGCTTQRRYHQTGLHIEWLGHSHHKSSIDPKTFTSNKISRKSQAETPEMIPSKESKFDSPMGPTNIHSNRHGIGENRPSQALTHQKNHPVDFAQSPFFKINQGNCSNSSLGNFPTGVNLQIQHFLKVPVEVKALNYEDPDRFKKIEKAAMIIYAVGLLVGLFALIFWSRTLAIITAAIMAIGFVVFLCCGGKANYFFSWVMSFLIGIGLLLLVLTKNGNFNGFFIP